MKGHKVWLKLLLLIDAARVWKDPGRCDQSYLNAFTRCSHSERFCAASTAIKPKALWAYKQARWMTCCCGIFCPRFHPTLSPLKIILEMIFWTNLMLDLICTWLEKTRRFCRQVNKKISSCFWTASTCVQRSSLGWCSRLTYMETVDWIHVGLCCLLVFETGCQLVLSHNTKFQERLEQILYRPKRICQDMPIPGPGHHGHSFEFRSGILLEGPFYDT